MATGVQQVKYLTMAWTTTKWRDVILFLHIMNHELYPQCLGESHQVGMIGPSLLPKIILVLAGQWPHKNIAQKLHIRTAGTTQR